LHPIKVAERWDTLGIDLIGPFTKTKQGFVYVITMTDLFTKWVVAKPICDKSAASVATVLVDTFYIHGPPRKIISDQGREFVNAVMKVLVT
jgi:Integrase core domain